MPVPSYYIDRENVYRHYKTGDRMRHIESGDIYILGVATHSNTRYVYIMSIFPMGRREVMWWQIMEEFEKCPE